MCLDARMTFWKKVSMREEHQTQDARWEQLSDLDT